MLDEGAIHSRHRLRQRKGRDEHAGPEGGIALGTELEVEDELPGIREDRGERDGLGDADECCAREVMLVRFKWRSGGAAERTEQEQLLSRKLVGIAAARCRGGRGSLLRKYHVLDSRLLSYDGLLGASNDDPIFRRWWVVWRIL